MTVTTSVGKNVRSRGVAWWMGFADTRTADRHDIDGVLNEGAGAQALDLQLDGGAEALQVQGGKGLLTGQARSAQIPLDAALSALGAPEGVAIEGVHDRASLAQWARTFCAGMEVPAAVATVLEPAIARDALGEAAAIRYYLARLDGEPVATAMLVLAAGVAGIYAVATIETARRRGIGAAVTLAPLLDARDRGYVAGVLQSSEMGYGVYARMGFTEQFRYHSYHFQPE
jgi:GNAT superfamily N-acetyltransferase